MSDDFFAPPPFKPDEALERIRRALRDLRGLTERGAARFDWKGMPVFEAAVDGDVVRVRVAKRPQRTPQWELKTLADGAAVRHFIDDFKRRFERWGEEPF